jgi:hypothetical protein
MSNCSKHKTEIEGYTLQELAIKLGDLRYDHLSIFLALLSEKIEFDSVKDQQRQRYKLAGQLHLAHARIQVASHAISDAWDVCKPHMDI